VLLHRLHCALLGWDAAAERRDAQDKLHSAAQGRAWADGDFDADHGLGLDGVGRSALEPDARYQRGAGGGCALALAVYKPPPPPPAISKIYMYQKNGSLALGSLDPGARPRGWGRRLYARLLW
jgi:hypothetical protein